MLRPSPSALRWVHAMAMVCLLLAWPLHQAQHASEPVSAAAQLGAVPTSAQPDHDQPEAAADACLWCLFHAQQLTPGGTPPALRLHAEADTPPTRLSSGLPARHCSLAADPRGPPLASAGHASAGRA